MFFGYLIRKLRYLNDSGRSHCDDGSDVPKTGNGRAIKINKKLQENLDSLKEMLGNSNDLKVHPFRFKPDNSLSGALVFIDGLVDNPTLTDAILRPVMNWQPEDNRPPVESELVDALAQEVLCAGGCQVCFVTV